ncbi:MAG: hypothetical protein ACLFPA_10345 [Dichotomicrobium sp.]
MTSRIVTSLWGVVSAGLLAGLLAGILAALPPSTDAPATAGQSATERSELPDASKLDRMPPPG